MKQYKCKMVGLLGGRFAKLLDCTRRVYSINGAMPTLTTCGGGHLEPKIMIKYAALDEQNGIIRTDGTIGTLTTDGSSPKHNNRVIEYDDLLFEPKQRQGVYKKSTERTSENTACEQGILWGGC